VALQRAGKKSEAEAVLRERLSQRPRDVDTRLQLADFLAEERRDPEAVSEYERVVAMARDHPRALNNLAVVYQRTKDPRAVEVAERAHKRRPKDPLIADTYGWILVGAGRVAEGLALLDGASRALPRSAEIRYHYALALARSGDKPKARTILERIAAEGGTFVRDPEAEKFLQ